MMTKKYVAAPGRIVSGWPPNGRPINELSRLQRNYVRDGDLIEKPEPVNETAPAPAKPTAKKETGNGQ